MAMQRYDIEGYAKSIASRAVWALTEEARLTPKPGLVDARSSGAHSDMSLELMINSAEALRGTFEEIASVSYLHPPNQELRERIARIGREGERRMYTVTKGVNTHKGAIWALGLLTSARAVCAGEADSKRVLRLAGVIASFEDRYCPMEEKDTNGQIVKRKYNISGAYEEAQQGFPHIRNEALPALLSARRAGKNEQEARLEALLALMAAVDDTCILHRGGSAALTTVKELAASCLRAASGNMEKFEEKFTRLSDYCSSRRLSPGGSADLLAAALFLGVEDERGREL